MVEMMLRCIQARIIIDAGVHACVSTVHKNMLIGIGGNE